MVDQKTESLQNLMKVCHRSGILPIFLGMLVIFIGAVNNDFYVIGVGLLIFILGYAFVKIADKIKKNIG